MLLFWRALESIQAIVIQYEHLWNIKVSLSLSLSLYSTHPKYQLIGSKTVFINLFIGIIELQN